MEVSVEEVFAKTTEEPREGSAPAPAAAARPDPEAIFALLRKEQSRLDRLKAD